MLRAAAVSLCSMLCLVPRVANATSSAELYTSSAYGYGRFEARVRFAAGDGVVSSFFLWKDGSEQPGVFWNELDDEKLGADCHLTTTAYFGNPAAPQTETPSVTGDLCGAYHVYAYEWTPDAIVWFVDGNEIRRETGATAQAYADNASAGMQIHFNVWPGDASFGGNFDPSVLPVFEYVDWVQFSSYTNGAFTLAWREDFSAPSLPSGWLTGNWASAKNLSTHDPRNVNFVNGFAVLSLTADDATGDASADPGPADGASGAGSGGASAGGASAGGASAGGASAGGASAGGASAGGASAGGASAGGASAGGTSAGGASGSMSASGMTASGTSAGGASGSMSAGGMTASGTSAGGMTASGTSAGGGVSLRAGGSEAASSTTEAGEHGGCSLGRAGRGGAWIALVAVAFAVVGRRRRARRLTPSLPKASTARS